LPSWLRKNFPESSKLSGRLTTFVKQGVGPENGEMGVGDLWQHFVAESLPMT
jgi:hypothetical protein